MKIIGYLTCTLTLSVIWIGGNQQIGATRLNMDWDNGNEVQVVEEYEEMWIGANQQTEAVEPNVDWNNGNEVQFIEEDDIVILFQRMGRITSALNFANMVITINATEVMEQATAMQRMIIMVKSHFKDFKRVSMLERAARSLRGHSKDLVRICKADVTKRSVAWGPLALFSSFISAGMSAKAKWDAQRSLDM